MAHGDSASKGVAILCKKDLNIKVHNTEMDVEGRYAVIYVTIAEKKFLIASLYAPNKDDPSFFKGVFHRIDAYASDYKIIGGDFNLGIDPLIDRKGKTIINNDKSANWIQAHMANNGLVDLWRQQYPTQSGFTWRRLCPQPSFSRLDYFLSTDSLMQLVAGTQILLGFRSDHSLLQFKLVLYKHVKGSGYWKINTALLRDRDYLDKINNLLDIELDQQFDSYKDKW